MFVHMCRWTFLWQTMEICTLGTLWCWWTWEENTGSAAWSASTVTSTVWLMSRLWAFKLPVKSAQEEVFNRAHALLSSSPGMQCQHDIINANALLSVCNTVRVAQCWRQSWRSDSALWAKFCSEDNKWLRQRSKFTFIQ